MTDTQRPPDPPAVCWSLTSIGWCRVDGGPASTMHVTAVARLRIALRINEMALFKVTERGSDGWCLPPDQQ